MRKDLKDNILILWRNHFCRLRQPRSVNILYRGGHYGMINGVIWAEDMPAERKQNTSFLKPLNLQGGHLIAQETL